MPTQNIKSDGSNFLAKCWLVESIAIQSLFFKAKNNFFGHKIYESQEIAMNLIFAPVQRRLQDQSFFRGTGSL